MRYHTKQIQVDRIESARRNNDSSEYQPTTLVRGRVAMSSAREASAIKYRPDIDGLRAVAVSAVIGAHLLIPKLAGGFVGVDVFFVISGYLISSIIFSEIAGSRFSLKSFYERRIRRIVPALF